MKASPLALSALLLWASICASAAADERRRIVVLEARVPDETAWPEGSRAVVAELAARDDELVLRVADTDEPGALSRTLWAAAHEPGTFGAVAVVRNESRGVALVQLRGQKGAIRVEDELSQGVIAEGAVALRVSELLHVRGFELPPSEAPAPTANVDAALAIQPWVAVGAFGSSGGEDLAPALALGARIPVAGAFEVEGSGALSLSGFEVATSAGTASISTQQIALHAYFNPAPNAPFGFALGLGGGVAWLSETARPAEGYSGRDAAAVAGLTSARAVASLSHGRLRWFALAEASLLVPSVRVRADADDLATLGRPWWFAALGLGFAP
jgi:hypothetical protein